jgi:hypothetical protein
VPPCGLPAGAPPPDSVEIGPVQPCGWSSPLLSGNTVRPVLHAESSGFLPSSLGWAWATPAVTPRQKTTRAKRIINPSDVPLTEHPRAAIVPVNLIFRRTSAGIPL